MARQCTENQRGRNIFNYSSFCRSLLLLNWDVTKQGLNSGTWCDRQTMTFLTDILNRCILQPRTATDLSAAVYSFINLKAECCNTFFPWGQLATTQTRHMGQDNNMQQNSFSPSRRMSLWLCGLWWKKHWHDHLTMLFVVCPNVPWSWDICTLHQEVTNIRMLLKSLSRLFEIIQPQFKLIPLHNACPSGSLLSPLWPHSKLNGLPSAKKCRSRPVFDKREQHGETCGCGIARTSN